MFDWSYPEFATRYGRDVIEKEAKPLVIASAEQVAEVNRLLGIVKLADDWTGKVFKAAGVDAWEDMDADKIAKCIDTLKGKLS